MKNFCLLVLVSVFFVSCRQTYYVVRHAEKETSEAASNMMKNDPPLTTAGKQRAETLKDELKSKKIGYIFSTNTNRTRSTAEPTREYFNLTTETYSPVPDPGFLSKLRSLKKNVLIVGHSNTVDDVVNKICGENKVAGDLPETIYDNLFVITRKGNKYSFQNKKYGTPTP